MNGEEIEDSEHTTDWLDGYEAGWTDSLDVERLTVALHEGDCVANGLGLHIAGSKGAYCTMIAPAVAREYAARKPAPTTAAS